jgi:hypothetical protein
MSEETERPKVDTAPALAAPTPPPPPPPPPAPEPQYLPWACLVGLVVLAGGGFLAWQNPNLPPGVTTAVPQLVAAQQRVADLESRIAKLEQRPAPAAGDDIGKLTARLNAAEARSADPAQLGARIDALSGRIEALSQRLGSSLEAAATALKTGLDGAKAQTDAVGARVAALEKNTVSVASVADRLGKLARLQDAAIALASGRPVGELPSAPAALAKFAKEAPPTDAKLRMTFAEAERAALAADQPDLADAPFVDRVWEKAQGLVTVKRGQDVVVGNTSAVVLGQAKAALDAGDLKLAVDALGKLAEAPKKAMAGWLGQANALLAARAALAAMAGQV